MPVLMVPDVSPSTRALSLGVARVAAGWRVLLVSTLGALVLAVGVIRGLSPEYTATMVVGPVARAGMAAMGPRAPSSPPGAAPRGLAEFGSGDEVLSDFTRFLQLLTAPPVAARLLAEGDLVPRMFPSRWDAEARRWKPEGGLSGRIKRGLLALAGRDDWLEPDAEIVAHQLRRLVVLQTIGSNPLRRLSLRDHDRVFALHLLERVASAADRQLRDEAKRRLEAEITYIRERLPGVKVDDYRNSLTDLLADHERMALMMGLDLPFAADFLEPPGASTLPDWPNPLVLIPLAGAAGLAFGVLLLFLRTWREVGGWA